MHPPWQAGDRCVQATRLAFCLHATAADIDKPSERATAGKTIAELHKLAQVIYALCLPGGGLFCEERTSLNQLLKRRPRRLRDSPTRFVSHVYILSDASWLFLKLHTGAQLAFQPDTMMYRAFRRR